MALGDGGVGADYETGGSLDLEITAAMFLYRRGDAVRLEWSSGNCHRTLRVSGPLVRSFAERGNCERTLSVRGEIDRRFV